MKLVTINVSEDVAATVFQHLNGDDGWRSTVGERFVRASENRGNRRQADELQRVVVALGAFSAAMARGMSGGDK